MTEISVLKSLWLYRERSYWSLLAPASDPLAPAHGLGNKGHNVMLGNRLAKIEIGHLSGTDWTREGWIHIRPFQRRRLHYWKWEAWLAFNLSLWQCQNDVIPKLKLVARTLYLFQYFISQFIIVEVQITVCLWMCSIKILFVSSSSSHVRWNGSFSYGSLLCSHLWEQVMDLGLMWENGLNFHIAKVFWNSLWIQPPNSFSFDLLPN